MSSKRSNLCTATTTQSLPGESTGPFQRALRQRTAVLSWPIKRDLALLSNVSSIVRMTLNLFSSCATGHTHTHLPSSDCQPNQAAKAARGRLLLLLSKQGTALYFCVATMNEQKPPEREKCLWTIAKWSEDSEEVKTTTEA